MSLILAGARRKILPQSKKGFKVQTLFMNGEAGGVYDPSDLTAEKVAWRRNLLTWSEDFTNAAWTKTFSTIAANNVVAPNGTLTADTVVTNVNTAIIGLYQGISVNAGTYTVSAYVKQGVNIRYLQLLYSSTLLSSDYVNFDLQTGTVTAGAYASASISLDNNGFYRITLTSALSTRSGDGPWLTALSSATAGRGSNYAGNGTDSFVAWGLQVEPGTTATAYQRITDFTSDFLAAFPTHGLYQDSAGTTPVTALGQPVGLVIDSKTGGLANLGTELVTNGDFSGGTTGWTAGAGSTIQVLSGQMRATNSTGSDGAYFGQQISFVAGRTYRLSADVISDGTSLASRIQLGTGLGTNNRLSYAAGFGTRTVFYMPTATETLWLWFYPAYQVVPNYIVLDNITVREVPGVHAIQPTSSSRPLLDGRVNLLNTTALLSGTGNTVTSNVATAPDGTVRAQRIAKTDTTTPRYAEQYYVGASVASNTSYTASRYFKYDGYDTTVSLEYNLTANWGTSWNAQFAVTASGITVSLASSCTAAVLDVGGGWYRCSATFTTGTITAAGVSYLTRITGTTGVSVQTFGGDLRLTADNAYPFQFVTSATDYADVGVPRSFAFDGFDDSLYTASNMDFATVTSDGLARRNLLTNPSQFDAAGWVLVNSTVTANSAIAPDGTTTAEKLVEDTATNVHTIVQSAFPAITTGATYTLSIFAKAAERTLICLRDNGTTNSGVFFDLSNGVVTSQEAAVSAASAIAAGNGWYRCIVTYTAGTTTANPQPRLVSTGTTQSYTGNGTSGLFIWGAQLEAGSTATTFQNIGTDKVTVLAGVRKLSDAATGMLAETSADVSANNGTFYLLWPRSGSLNGVQSASKGTVASVANSGNTYAAPATRVLAVLADISGDALSNRINGVVDGTSATDQGTGNYGSYVLFIGRRNNASLPFNGKAYQIIVRGALTDDATLAQAQRYVAKKTGVTI